jgi:hypothetical protein
MKIEASKNNAAQQARRESKNVFKTEASSFDGAAVSSKVSASVAAQSGAFAKILEETRTEKDSPASGKTDSAESDSTTSKSERDEKNASAIEDKKDSEERDSQNGSADAGENTNEHQSALPASAVLTSHSGTPEKTAPAARAILHVADLERLISAIRAETFRNQKGVLIALKNSVLQGLQIRLTITENGRIKAEFLALDEEIKKQLNRRKNELAEILKNRSPLFSEIEIKARNAPEKE